MRERGHPDARLSAFLDDELDEAEALQVTRHLAACPRCVDELEGLRAARSVLRDLPPVASPATDELVADVPDVAQQVGRRRRVQATVGGVLAGLAGVLGLAFVLGGTEQGEVVPPVEVVVVDHVVRTGGGPVLQPVDLDR